MNEKYNEYYKDNRDNKENKDKRDSRNNKNVYIKGKKSGGKHFYQQQSWSSEDREKLSELDKIVKGIVTRVNSTEKNFSNKENTFREENINKDIFIITVNGKEVRGKLVDIDKYRIAMEIDDKLKYFYKHSIIGYGVL